MSVRLAEPPSEVGTGGGQRRAAEWLEAAAVDAAACDEVSGVSPGNCKGACEVFEDDALLPPVVTLPALPNDPVAVADPLAVPADVDPVEDDDPVGTDDVGRLSGSEPTPSVEAV